MTLHIHGQQSWHDSAYIVGTREDLIKLRDAIDAAIGLEKKIAMFYVNDGEGYDVMIYRVDEHTAGRLAVPYTEEMAAEHASDKVWPWDLRWDIPKT